MYIFRPLRKYKIDTSTSGTAEDEVSSAQILGKFDRLVRRREQPRERIFVCGNLRNNSRRRRVRHLEEFLQLFRPKSIVRGLGSAVNACSRLGLGRTRLRAGLRRRCVPLSSEDVDDAREGVRVDQRRAVQRCGVDRSRALFLRSSRATCRCQRRRQVDPIPL